MGISLKKNLIGQAAYILLAIFFTLWLYNTLETGKNLTLVSIVWILFLIALNFYSSKFTKFDEILFSKQKTNITIFLSLFGILFILISQNRHLNFETITWDISSYLVASNDLDDNLIPFTTQWESKGPLSIYIYYLFVLQNS